MEKEDVQKINNILISKLKIKDNDPCFCGSGLIFSDCCKKETRFWLSQKFVDKIIRYAKANNFKIDNIPMSFLKEYEIEFLKIFNKCSNPACNNKCIGSHIFGRSLIRKYFEDTFCQWFEINDNGIKQLIKIGISNDIKYPIFCSICDNNIFKSIDNIDHDLLDTDNQLLHLVRIISFQYQYTRTQLALSHQLVFSIVPISSARRSFKNEQTKNETINLTWFHKNFIRYKHQKELLDFLWEILNNKTKYKIYSRVISSDNIIFSNGIINPQYDLSNKKMTFTKQASILYLTLPISKNEIIIISYSYNNEYDDYIKQLYLSNDYKFKKTINSFLSYLNTPYSIMLDSNFKIKTQVLGKINSKKEKIIKFV